MIHDKFGNPFKSQEEMSDFYYRFYKTAKEFSALYEKITKYYNETEILDLIKVHRDVWDSELDAYDINERNLMEMQFMINKYTNYPINKTKSRQDLRKLMLAKNSREVSRAKMPVMDIWDADTKTVERDELRDRKKKSAKSKPKRKIIKKCKCK
jgi:hypothetical protein